MPRNVRKKPWYTEAVSLDTLLEQLQKIKDDNPARPCKVIGVVTDPSLRSGREAEIAGVITRSLLLDHQVGEHLNRLSGDATDEEIAESTSDAQNELVRDGEVVYIVLGPIHDAAPKEIYEV